MNVSLKPNKEKSEVTLEITLPAADFDAYLKKAAKKLGTEHKIPGFRPGTAPVNVVVQHLGEQRVLNTAADLALPTVFIQALVDNDLEAIGRPQVTMNDIGLTKDFRFTATVALLPEVTLPDVKTISVSKRVITIDNADVDRELTYLAKLRSTFLEVPKPAETGDTVVVDFDVKIDGKTIEGGSSTKHPVHLGEDGFIPEFEDKLVGITAGEERSFPVTFPKDFAREDYRDKKADITVKAHHVQKRIMPEINDEFAKKIGKFTDLNHLKTELKTNLGKEKQDKEKERLRGELTEQLADKATFGFIPEVMIEKEIDRKIHEFSHLLGYQNKTIDQHLAEKKQTMEQLRTEVREPALKNLKVGLALRQFIKEQKITVPDDVVEQKAKEYLARFTSTKAAKDKIDPHDLRDDIKSQLQNQLALEKLEELANVSEEKASEVSLDANQKIR